MRDRSRTLTVVNTRKRTESGNGSPVANYSSSGSPSLGGGLTVPLKRELLGIIAENYADSVTQLMADSYLYNPAFADDADGWTITEEDSVNKRVEIVISDNKKRLQLTDTGSILQSNDRIRKPGTHKEYVYTENKEEDSGEEGTGGGFTPSDTLVTEQVSWGGIEEPEKTEGEEEKPDTLYLTLHCICKKSGTISVGFVGADESSEEALKLQTVTMEKSDDIQVITAQGTWDGKGDFTIYLTEGSFEIASVLLLDKPLEEYRKQTDSNIRQITENLEKTFKFIRNVIGRITHIQSHVNQLYSNDAIFSGLLEGFTNRMDELEKRVETLGGGTK